MKKFLDNLVPVISGICITSMLMGALLALGRCSIEQDERVRAANTYQYEITYVVYHPTEAKVHKRTANTYQYEITYVVYHPTEAKVHKRTGQCSYSDKHHRPHYEKRTRYAKNRLLVDHDEIYKGTDDFEVTDFTYHKVNNNK